MTSQPVDPTAAAAQVPGERRELSVRRAPKFVPFMIAGALVGVIVAGILAYNSPGVEQFALSSIFGFFAVLLVLPGVGLGAAVALVIDRQSVRKARTAVLEEVPEGDEGDLPA